MKEIKKTGEVFKDKDGKKWLPVNLSHTALRIINKTVLGEKWDKDDFELEALKMDVHDDCVELFKEFTQ